MTAMSTDADAPRAKTLMLAWLWPDLLIGALSVLFVFATGIDFTHASWQIPFALAEFLAVGLPVAIVYSLIVYGLVVATWAVARKRVSVRAQAPLFGLVAFGLSTGILFGLLSLIPLRLPLLPYSLLVGLAFGTAHVLQYRRARARSQAEEGVDHS